MPRDKWQELLEAWDRQQGLYRPDRESGLRAMCEVVVRGQPSQAPTVLDLACGCGSVTARLLDALPSASIIAIDRDPVLLRIARELWVHDTRVVLRRADLRDEAWREWVGDDSVDAVVTAASLHWFEPDDLTALYRSLASVLRPGGVFVNLDWIPVAHAPALRQVSDRYIDDLEQRASAGRDAQLSPWRAWWAQVLADPDLAAEARQRDAMKLPRPAEFFGDEDWHRSQLMLVGFTEVAVIWRSFSSAVIVAVASA